MPISSTEQPAAGRAHTHGGFRTTHWSLIVTAGKQGGSLHSAEALEKLCRDYWPSIYAWVRRSGRRPEEAEDITQDFFTSLLRYDSFAKVDPRKGRFRSFLLASLKNFLANRWHRERAKKRGGGRPIFSLDATPALESEIVQPHCGDSPEKAFDRSWAHMVLGRVLDRLRHEYDAAGQGRRFDILKSYLLAGAERVSYAESARELGVSESAVKSAIYTMRRRYAMMVRAEVAQTVGDAADVDDEIRALLEALAG